MPANAFTPAQKWPDAMEIDKRQLSAELAHDALAAKAKYLLEQQQHNEAFALTFTGMMNAPIDALNYAAVYRRLVDDPTWVVEGSHWGLRDFDYLRDWARVCRYFTHLLPHPIQVLCLGYEKVVNLHLFWGRHTATVTVAFADSGVCGRVKVVLTQHGQRADQSNSLLEMPRA